MSVALAVTLVIRIEFVSIFYGQARQRQLFSVTVASGAAFISKEEMNQAKKSYVYGNMMGGAVV